MAADGRRNRYSRAENGIVYNTRELVLALQRAKENEDAMKSKVARLEDENATLRSRVDALRKATAPSVFKKIEGTETTAFRVRRSLSPIANNCGAGIPQSSSLLPSAGGSSNRPQTAASGDRVPAFHEVNDMSSVRSRVADLERQLTALDKKRLQEVSRWRKKYDELQGKWMKRGSVQNEEHTRSQLRSKSRVGRQSELLIQSQIADELRVEIQELRGKNKQLTLENGLLSCRLEEMQATCTSQDRHKTEKEVGRKYRDMLDRSERKIEELQRTNLKLHSMLKEVTFKLRSGSRVTLLQDSLSLSTKNAT